MKSIKSILLEEITQRLEASHLMSDEEIQKVIDDVIIKHSSIDYIPFRKRKELRKELFHSIRGLDVLQELIEDEEITEIMVNGSEHIFLERKGKLFSWEKTFESQNKLEDVIQQIVSGANRVVNEANPIVDARLPDGSRVNVVLPPIALDGPILTIRKFPKQPIDIETLVQMHSITQEVANFLSDLIKAGYNILISGGTGSGKTTFLNILSNFIPKDQRVVTIEDSAELQIRGVSNLVRMEMRNANVEGKGEITIRDLIKTALRQRPDWIIIGEVRDGAALDMLNCMNTGHRSASSIHSNSAADLLNRLEALVLMAVDLPPSSIRRQIASAVDLIVHLGRLRDKSRKVLEIVEVLEYKEEEIKLNPLFLFQEEGSKGKGEEVLGELKRIGTLCRTEKLRRAGILSDRI